MLAAAADPRNAMHRLRYELSYDAMGEVVGVAARA
jgi:hypothetical protein